MKLYYVPRTRAGRVRWLLEELETPHELVRLDIGAKENRTAEYLAIHPHGSVPALVDGAVTMIESAAICLYLADKYPEKGLAPAPGSPERAPYYQWILYAAVTAEAPVLDYFRHTVTLAEHQRDAAVAESTRARFAEIARVIEAGLVGRPYLTGERFNAADIILGSVLLVARAARLLDDRPVLADYTRRLLDRPACKRARAD